MKKIILFSLLIAIASCKSKKNADCDAYGSLDFNYITTDTLYLGEEHIHIEEEHLCFWSPAEKYIIIDTIKVRVDRK